METSEINKINNKAINFLNSLDINKTNNIKTKFRNICGKTGRYNVAEELYQKRTARKNRAEISWKSVIKNNLIMKNLETFEGGVVVSFNNEDFYNPQGNEQLHKELLERLGSDEKVSSIISFRTEDGTSSSAIPRKYFNMFISGTKLTYKGKEIFINEENWKDYILEKTGKSGMGNEIYRVKNEVKMENSYKIKKIDEFKSRIYRGLYFNNDQDSNSENWSLYDLLKNTQGFVAGGAFKTLDKVTEEDYKDDSVFLFCYFYHIKDIDVFFDSEEKFNNACKILKKNNFDQLYETPNAIGFSTKHCNVTIELIRRNFRKPIEILKTFDFIIAKKAMLVDENGELVVIEHKDYSNCYKKNSLEIDKIEFNSCIDNFTSVGIFERLYKYIRTYKYKMNDNDLNFLLHFINSNNCKKDSINFKNFKKILGEPNIFVSDYFQSSSNRFQSKGATTGDLSLDDLEISYYSKLARELVFDDLLELDFEKKEELVEENVKLLKSIFDFNVTLSDKTIITGKTYNLLINIMINVDSYVEHFRLNKLLKNLETIYKDGFKDEEEKYKILYLVSGHFGPMKQFEVFYFLNLGLSKYGKDFINYIIKFWFSDGKTFVLPFADWVYLIENNLLDVEISPVVTLPLYFGSSGIIANYDHYIFNAAPSRLVLKDGEELLEDYIF